MIYANLIASWFAWARGFNFMQTDPMFSLYCQLIMLRRRLNAPNDYVGIHRGIIDNLIGSHEKRAYMRLVRDFPRFSGSAMYPVVTGFVNDRKEVRVWFAETQYEDSGVMECWAVGEYAKEWRALLDWLIADLRNQLTYVYNDGTLCALGWEDEAEHE